MHLFSSSRVLACATALLLVFVTSGCASGEGGAGAGGGDGSGGAGGDRGTGGTAGSGGDGGAGGSAGMGGTGGMTGGGGSAGTGGVGGEGGGNGVGDPSALDAIDAALEAGDITDIDALRFKVFAVFGDERLPEPHRASGRFEGTEVVEDLGERWATLPLEVQQELEPFMLPPSADGSWLELRQAQASKSFAPKAIQFRSKTALNNTVRISYPADFPELSSAADAVKGALEIGQVWSTLTGLMGREPLSDEGIHQHFNHGDERFDFYILRAEQVDEEISTCYGWTQAYDPSYYVEPPTDDRRAAYVVINADKAATPTPLRAAVAHELFHAIGRAFNVPPGDDRKWLTESTASWAEHATDTEANTEHEYVEAFLDRPWLTLTNRFNDHDYGSWLYWYFLTKRFDDDTIVRQVWEHAESMSMIEAVNAATPGGLLNTFPEFAATNWNLEGVSDNEPYDIYREDSLPDQAQTLLLEAKPNPEKDLPITFEGGGVARLSAQYVRYILTHPDDRTLLFANGYTFELAEGVPEALQSGSSGALLYAKQMTAEARVGRRVLAFIKQKGAWRPQPFDLTNVAFAPFCNEAGSESIEELALVFVNAEHREDEPFYAIPAGLPPRLRASNIGCGKWVGSGGAVQTIIDESRTETSIVDIQSIEFTRETLTLDEIAAGEGQIRFGDEVLPPSRLPALNWFVGDVYELTGFSATWSFDEDFTFGGTVCSGGGGGALTLADAYFQDFQMGTHLREGIGGTNTAPLYRSFYFQMGLLTTNTPVTGTCISNGQSSPYEDDFDTFLQGGYRDTPEWGMLLIDPAGNRINENWSSDTMDIDLDLTSGPIP